MRRWILVVLMVAAAVAAWLALRPSAPRTPEERIRAALDQAARAAGERKVDGVVALLSERFHGRAGGESFTRDDARRLVALEVLRGRWVSVEITGVTAVVDGPRARASVHAVLSRATDRSKGLASLLPGEAAAHRFQLDLEEEDGQWRVVSAGWRPIEVTEALSGPPEPDW
jgi:hypothetical protein